MNYFITEDFLQITWIPGVKGKNYPKREQYLVSSLIRQVHIYSMFLRIFEQIINLHVVNVYTLSVLSFIQKYERITWPQLSQHTFLFGQSKAR